MMSGESFKSDNRRDKRWKQRETKRRVGKKYSSIQREIEEIGYVPATFVNYGVTKLASGKSVVGRMPREIKPPRREKNGKEEKLISSWFDLPIMWYIYIYWPRKYSNIFYQFNQRLLQRWCITNNTNNSKKNICKIKAYQAFISIQSLREKTKERKYLHWFTWFI